MDVIGLRMKDFQDMYEVTENLGGPSFNHSVYYYYRSELRLPSFTCFTFYFFIKGSICVFKSFRICYMSNI